MPSPYEGLPESEYLNKTSELIKLHSLDAKTILEVVLTSWNSLWSTRIGAGEDSIPITQLDLPATVVGYFLEKLIARELSLRYPNRWRGQIAKSEKDLVCLDDTSQSVEIKTSGQLGTRIFGNRSYGKKSIEDEVDSKPEKSGYYLTINFYGRTITLVRFGWIDKEDWRSQKAETGQAATLSDYVYSAKLVPVRGDYQLQAPAAILSGVGPRLALSLSEVGINTVGDVLQSQNHEKVTSRLLEAAKRFVGSDPPRLL